MEGASRFIKAYNLSNMQKCCFKSCCYCCTKDREEMEAKLFQGQMLSVKRASDPSLINWQNLGITKW